MELTGIEAGREVQGCPGQERGRLRRREAVLDKVSGIVVPPHNRVRGVAAVAPGHAVRPRQRPAALLVVKPQRVAQGLWRRGGGIQQAVQGHEKGGRVGRWEGWKGGGSAAECLSRRAVLGAATPHRQAGADCNKTTAVLSGQLFSQCRHVCPPPPCSTHCAPACSVCSKSLQPLAPAPAWAAPPPLPGRLDFWLGCTCCGRPAESCRLWLQGGSCLGLQLLPGAGLAGAPPLLLRMQGQLVAAGQGYGRRLREVRPAVHGQLKACEIEWVAEGKGEGSQESGKQLPQRGRTESKLAHQIDRVNEEVRQRLGGLRSRRRLTSLQRSSASSTAAFHRVIDAAASCESAPTAGERALAPRADRHPLKGSVGRTGYGQEGAQRRLFHH